MTNKSLRDGADKPSAPVVATASAVREGCAHSPGPWRWDEDRHGTDNGRIVGADNKPVCYFGDEDWDCRVAGEAPNNADKAVMLAAPELLAALKALLNDIDSGVLVRDISRDGRSDWAMEMLTFVQRLQAAQSAIAKAEGR